ncbi:MAG TPA: pyridoxal-phosphate dependent enzyme, partial [Acidobacteriota bacterium]|nr:pyridoxal-phosphate dependent enzyme [Acidobacteriota bacterium]
SGGWGEMASDPEILSAIRLLAETEGIFTEPAGGTTLAVAIKLIEQGRIEKDSVLVVGITGNGYKAADALENEVAISAHLRPNLRIFQQWYREEGAADASLTRRAVGG